MLFKCLLYMVVTFVSLISIAMHSTPCVAIEPLSVKEQTLWKKTVSLYLKDALWLEDEAYDASHTLMVPMHVAFMLNDTVRIKEFDEHIKCFIDVYKQSEFDEQINIVEGRLNKLQYFYLLSEYIKLSAVHNRNSASTQLLSSIIYNYIDRIWLQENAWQWGKKEGFRNMKERLLWKISQQNTNPTYLKAIIDEELFVFGIAADLKTYYGIQNKDALLNDILNVAYTVFQREGEFDSSGRWLMQRGVWAEHRDYLYASYLKASPGLERFMVKGISSDTSHSHRLPLLLNSLRDAADQVHHKIFYSDILKGLNKQFFDIVVKKPSLFSPYYRTTNYMDGRNGLYRYGYKTMPMGMGPYELSGTITLGWWGFLHSTESKAMYKYMSAHKLTGKAVKLYVGANTTRRRNPLVTWPDFFYNGFAELIAHCASRL